VKGEKALKRWNWDEFLRNDIGNGDFNPIDKKRSFGILEDVYWINTSFFCFNLEEIVSGNWTLEYFFDLLLKSFWDYINDFCFSNRHWIIYAHFRGMLPISMQFELNFSGKMMVEQSNSLVNQNDFFTHLPYHWIKKKKIYFIGQQRMKTISGLVLIHWSEIEVSGKLTEGMKVSLKMLPKVNH
jgi:hypothetical protein